MDIDSWTEYDNARKALAEAERDYYSTLDNFFPVAGDDPDQPTRGSDTTTDGAFTRIQEADDRFKASQARLTRAIGELRGIA